MQICDYEEKNNQKMQVSYPSDFTFFKGKNVHTSKHCRLKELSHSKNCETLYTPDLMCKCHMPMRHNLGHGQASCDAVCSSTE